MTSVSRSVCDGAEDAGPSMINLLKTSFTPRIPNILNSSGQNVVACETSGKTCFINAELIDWENAMEDVIRDFGPTGTISDFGGKAANCVSDMSSNVCQNWDKINRYILPQYCQRIGYFTNFGGDSGDCPPYNVNPFNPVYPQSKGCSKMTSLNSLCREWVMAGKSNTSAGKYLGIVDNNIVKYCDGQLTTDCACQRASESVVFNEVSVRGVGTTTCWWEPCQSASQEGYLIQKNDVPPVCPKDICVNVSNIFLDNSEIGKSLIVSQVNACGNPIPTKRPWYEQWWFWIIVFGFIIIIFATIIYYTSTS